MSSKLLIIDYGMGNLHSILRKFHRLNIFAEISGDPGKIRFADKLVLPGVGHFANGMKNLNERNIIGVLNEKVLVKKTPILGICLGMQLFAQTSEEGFVPGLGWIDSAVVRFKVNDTLKYKVPHIGWNNLAICKQAYLLNNINEDCFFYFVHSYHMICKSDNDNLSETTYEHPFTSAVAKNNIFGTQFHPEKSFEAGEQVLRNFSKI